MTETATTASASVVAIPLGRWAVDVPRSRVGFRVRHLGLTWSYGQFGQFEGTIERSHEGVTARGAVKAASVMAGSAVREKKLRARSCFDAATWPEIVLDAAADAANGFPALAGDLTIRGITYPVALRLSSGPVPLGSDEFSLTACGLIDRTQFGVRFRTAFGLADFAVAHAVELDIEAVFVRAPATRPAAPAGG